MVHDYDDGQMEEFDFIIWSGLLRDWEKVSCIIKDPKDLRVQEKIPFQKIINMPFLKYALSRFSAATLR